MTDRGRPRSFDREAALAAATQLFWRKGFTATSIAELCATMGIGPPSLYAAFGSKEALYVEALEHYEASMGPVIWKSVAEEPTARAAVEGWLLASARQFSEGDHPPGCMVTLSAAGSEGCAPLGDLTRQKRADGRAILEERLKVAQKAGEIAGHADTAAIARFYLTVQQGLSLQARDGATYQEMAAAVAMAMRGWDSLAA